MPEGPLPRFSIILPARNEEHRIEQTVETYHRYMQRDCSVPFEIVVVTNACTDRTGEIVEGLFAKNPSLRLIDLQEPGKGRAVLRGLAEAKGDIVIFCDSDGATDAADVLRLLQIVEQGRCDCAIGSRWLPDSKVPIPQPLKRRIASRLFNLAVRLIFGFPYKDTQCGAKAVNRRASEAIASGVTALGYHFDCDILWQLKRAGLSVLEVPITWRDQGGSGVQVGRDGLKMLFGLFKIRVRRSTQKG